MFPTHLAAILSPVATARRCAGLPMFDAPMRAARRAACPLALLLSALSGTAALAAMGMTSLPQDDGGLTTVFYPTAAAEVPAQVGPFRLSWAADAAPLAGNGRLVVISHGSGGTPWVHADLARALVQGGFTVAVPQHRGDNAADPSEPGPPSWVRRPQEVSAAIDRIGADARFIPLLRLDAVGMFGGSAGGHTALSLAGGAWSPARFRDHCGQHIAEDFSSCVGFLTLQDGGWLDGLKRWVAQRVISLRFGDTTPQRHTDGRVQAVVAMVPFAADFDPASLRAPVVPLGLVIAGRDINQVPAFHAEAVLQACAPRCSLLLRLPDAGHGAMLSPLPPFPPGSLASRLLDDPPGFDRTAAIPAIEAAVVGFFHTQLVDRR